VFFKFSTAHAVLNILYPERLGLALIIIVPLLVDAFFKIILPFVDPHTRQKTLTLTKLDTLLLAVKEWWGGEQDFECVHEKYWPRLVEMSEGQDMDSKRELGAKVGIVSGSTR